MESFFRTHKYLVEHLGNPTDRLLMKQIDWSRRLIAVKGTRGVGKTTFLLQYARDYFDIEKRDCLYINLNQFYFTENSIIDFAKDFVAGGGRTLILDQIYKYPNWSSELKECYVQLPELRIVFSGSTVLKLSQNKELASIVDIYNLRGFSYREFLNILFKKSFKAYTLEDIITDHQQIAAEICLHLDPTEHFWSYLHHGYYPFFLEKRNFSENLLKTINMMLEVDVLSIRQVEHSYLPKLRKLLYLLSLSTPGKPNISQLSIDCEISRATVTNYLEYLKSARLINMVYRRGEEFPKKPDMVYMHNTNLVFLFKMNETEDQELCETFFYNQLHHSDCLIKKGPKNAMFIVEKNGVEYNMKVKKQKDKERQKDDIIYVIDKIKTGNNNSFPLWLLGFLY